MSDIDTQHIPFAQSLNCSGNGIRKLTVAEPEIKTLQVKNNSEYTIVICT